jgi:hypothetical protein
MQVVLYDVECIIIPTFIFLGEVNNHEFLNLLSTSDSFNVNDV